MKRKQLISSDEATPVAQQIRKPCSDCPMARSALPGWLGGATPEEYRRLCHSDAVVDCHVHGNVQCAGVAIFRANVYKDPRTPEALRLPQDTERVFMSDEEFLRHHTHIPKNRRKC